jgi:hypothetical protein
VISNWQSAPNKTHQRRSNHENTTSHQRFIVPAVSNDDAKVKYPQGWQSPLPYLRVVAQPQ